MSTENVDPVDQVVYVTRQGKRYHTRFCAQGSNRRGGGAASKTAVPLTKAVQQLGLQPCPVCKPPTLPEPGPTAETFRPLVDTVQLCSSTAGWESVEATVRALLFGELVKRSRGVTNEYLSDLYHDALYIQKYVNGPTEFWWMARATGTEIGGVATLAERYKETEPRVLYHVAVSENRGRWSATFSEFIRYPANQGEST